MANYFEDPKLIDAYLKVLFEVKDDSNVHSVDIGYKYKDLDRTNDVCIRVFCKNKEPDDRLLKSVNLKERIPEIEIDVIEGRSILNLNSSNPSMVRFTDLEKIQPGDIITCGFIGTLGAFIKFDDGKFGIKNVDGIISAGHSLNPPDEIRDIKYKNLTIGGFHKSLFREPWDLPYSFGKEVVAHYLDAAIGVQSSNLDIRSFEVKSLGGSLPITGVVKAYLGQVLFKYSATTGITWARVEGKGVCKFFSEDGNYRFIYGIRLKPCENPFTKSINFEISRRGDSGAIWYEIDSQNNTAKAVAVHSKGDLDTERFPIEFAFASCLTDILDHYEDQEIKIDLM